MANFFTDRPIFAWVIAIILSLSGLLALNSLPVEQYPNLAPPTVRISASYPGRIGPNAGKHGHPNY
ncbi:Acriflavine resistance protein B [Leminorella grimontii]|nr:Acriflavine resistance protein B [Leminorella grimontii]